MSRKTIMVYALSIDRTFFKDEDRKKVDYKVMELQNFTELQITDHLTSLLKIVQWFSVIFQYPLRISII